MMSQTHPIAASAIQCEVQANVSRTKDAEFVNYLITPLFAESRDRLK